MMSTPSELSANWPSRFGIRDPHPPCLFHRAEDLDRTPRPVGQAHTLRRAFEYMKLDGIWCPPTGATVFFKVVDSIGAEELDELHRLVWNQGLAPLLVVVEAREVRIYSGLSAPTPSRHAGGHGRSLIESLNLSADALELSRFALKVQTGEFFRTHARAFDPDLRVERRLLENLKTARDQLRDVSRAQTEGPERERLFTTLDAVLCRVVFTCYLVDRGVIDDQYFEHTGAGDATRLADLFGDDDPTAERRRLYSLFSGLQRDFNGDLFAADLVAEEKLIEDGHLRVLGRLLQGEDLVTGQLSFLDYDFSVIPIETISAIYEHFLADRRKIGAFFTPPGLAEMVLKVATGTIENLLEKRFLDPSCGSGIFLVVLFNRLAEEWRRNHPAARYETQVDALIQILKRNIFGIDINETACRIAAFSLYLALLDQLDPPDIRRLQRRGRLLPGVVFTLEETRGRNGWVILNSSFGRIGPEISDEGFDLILGNPPWVSRGGVRADQARDWPDTADVEVAQGQVAYLFISKAPQHLKSRGRVCFLLPSGILFNHSHPALQFQLRWLKKNIVENVFNLSDLRYLLFDGAVRPALIVSYRPRRSQLDERNPEHDVVKYFTPKAGWTNLRANVLAITDSHTTVSLRSIVHKLEKQIAPTEWKERLWGTPRDWKLLDRLSLLPALSEIVGQPYKGEKKRWIIGQGFKPENPREGNGTKRPDPKPRPWQDDQLFVEGRSPGIDLLLLENDCAILGDRFRELHRDPKTHEIYRPPHVLVTQGLRVAFCDVHVVFRHSVQGIHGKKADRKLLMFLAAFLRSSLARYYLFHTVANWGVERDKVHLEELLRIPFPLPEDTPDPGKARTAVRDVASLMSHGLKRLQAPLVNRSSIVEPLLDKIRPYIYQYFDIDELEEILIEDTNRVSIPSKMPKRGQRHPPPALMPSKREERASYLSILCDLINEWSMGVLYHISGSITVSRAVGCGVVELTRSRADAPQPKLQAEKDSTEELDSVLARVQELRLGLDSVVRPDQEFKVFDGPRLYLLKPLILRFWTRTVALNDADEIASAILSASRSGPG